MLVCVCWGVACSWVCELDVLVSVCTCVAVNVCVNSECVWVLQLSCAADMWLIRCHQCVFEM